MREDTQRAQFLGAGAKFKEWFSREEGRQRTKHSTAATASQGDSGVPVLTVEALPSSSGPQASCQAARRWTWDPVGQGSAAQSSKEPVGGPKPAWESQAEAAVGGAGRARV